MLASYALFFLFLKYITVISQLSHLLAYVFFSKSMKWQKQTSTRRDGGIFYIFFLTVEYFTFFQVERLTSHFNGVWGGGGGG